MAALRANGSRAPESDVASDGGLASGGGRENRRWLAPRLEMGCHIAMCVAMAFMLVLML